MTHELSSNGSGSREDPSSSNQETLFESLLIAYDEALARGEALTPDESLVPPELLPRLRAALQCLTQLAEARRREVAAPAAKNVPTVAPRPTPPMPKVGRFHLLHELGRGGHGVVFLAIDPRLGRLVALKVPRPEALIAPDLFRRFLREAQAASSLTHPNVVPIFEVGEDGPLCYLAAAYCPGPSLAAWLDQRATPASFREAGELIAALADAVEHAHQRGILHRDLKPANVLLEPAGSGSPPHACITLGDERYIPRLTDFGLAKLLDEGQDDTRTGVLLGTPSYMAPEQVAGKLGRIGPATDVYGLGATLYETLVGRPPFRGDNDADTLRQVASEEVVRPASLRNGVPRDLEAICLKCLEKSSARRYAAAGELAADLRRFLQGQPTVARPLGLLGRALR